MYSDILGSIILSLPLTLSSFSYLASPTGLKAAHAYFPECSDLTPRNTRLLSLESTVFMINFAEDMRGKSSLYHCSVMGSSPMAVQDIWISWPTVTSSGNKKGNTSGGTEHGMARQTISSEWFINLDKIH